MHHVFVKDDNSQWHVMVHVNDQGLVDSVGYPRTNGAVPPPDVFPHMESYDQARADKWMQEYGWVEDPAESQRMDEVFKKNPDMYKPLEERWPDTFGPQAKTAETIWTPFLCRSGQTWVGEGAEINREEHYDLFETHEEDIMTSYEQDKYHDNTTDFKMDMIAGNDPTWLRGVFSPTEVRFLDPSHEASADMESVAACVMDLFQYGLKSKNPLVLFYDTRTPKKFKELVGLDDIKFADLTDAALAPLPVGTRVKVVSKTLGFPDLHSRFPGGSPVGKAGYINEGKTFKGWELATQNAIDAGGELDIGPNEMVYHIRLDDGYSTFCLLNDLKILTAEGSVRFSDLSEQALQSKIVKFFIGSSDKMSEEYTPEEGANPDTTTSFDLSLRTGQSFSSIEELANQVGIPEDPKYWFAFDNRIQCSILENAEGNYVEPSNRDYTEWEAGRTKLWLCDYSFWLDKVWLEDGTVIRLDKMEDDAAEQLLSLGLEIRAYGSSGRDPELSMVVESALESTADLGGTILEAPALPTRIGVIAIRKSSIKDSYEEGEVGDHSWSTVTRDSREYPTFESLAEAYHFNTDEDNWGIMGGAIVYIQTEDAQGHVVHSGDAIWQGFIEGHPKYLRSCEYYFYLEYFYVGARRVNTGGDNNASAKILEKYFGFQSIGRFANKRQHMPKFSDFTENVLSTPESKPTVKWIRDEVNSEGDSVGGGYIGHREFFRTDHLVADIIRYLESEEAVELRGGSNFTDGSLMGSRLYGESQPALTGDGTESVDARLLNLTKDEVKATVDYFMRGLAPHHTMAGIKFSDLAGDIMDQEKEQRNLELKQERHRKKVTKFELPADFVGASVSHGTLDIGDLISACVSFLKNYAPAVWEYISIYDSDDIQEWEEATEAGDDSEYWSDESANYFLEHLEDWLNTIAPKNTWFGANEGDGADMGFWSVPEEERVAEGSIKFSDLTEDALGSILFEWIDPSGHTWVVDVTDGGRWFYWFEDVKNSTISREHPGEMRRTAWRFVGEPWRSRWEYKTKEDDQWTMMPRAYAERVEKAYQEYQKSIGKTADLTEDALGFGVVVWTDEQDDEWNIDFSKNIYWFDDSHHTVATRDYPSKMMRTVDGTWHYMHHGSNDWRPMEHSANVEKLYQEWMGNITTSSMKFSYADTVGDIAKFAAKAKVGQIWRINDYKLYNKDAYIVREPITVKGSGTEHEGWTVSGIAWIDRNQIRHGDVEQLVNDPKVRFQVSYMYPRQFPMTLIGDWKTGVMEQIMIAPSIEPIKREPKIDTHIDRPSMSGPAVGATVTAVATDDELKELANAGEVPAHTGETGTIDSVLPSLVGPWRRHPQYVGVILIKSGDHDWYIPYSDWQKFISLQPKTADLNDIVFQVPTVGMRVRVTGNPQLLKEINVLFGPGPKGMSGTVTQVDSTTPFHPNGPYKGTMGEVTVDLDTGPVYVYPLTGWQNYLQILEQQPKPTTWQKLRNLILGKQSDLAERSLGGLTVHYQKDANNTVHAEFLEDGTGQFWIDNKEDDYVTGWHKENPSAIRFFKGRWEVRHQDQEVGNRFSPVSDEENAVFETMYKQYLAENDLSDTRIDPWEVSFNDSKTADLNDSILSQPLYQVDDSVRILDKTVGAVSPDVKKLVVGLIGKVERVAYYPDKSDEVEYYSVRFVDKNTGGYFAPSDLELVRSKTADLAENSLPDSRVDMYDIHFGPQKEADLTDSIFPVLHIGDRIAFWEHPGNRGRILHGIIRAIETGMKEGPNHSRFNPHFVHDDTKPEYVVDLELPDRGTHQNLPAARVIGLAPKTADLADTILQGPELPIILQRSPTCVLEVDFNTMSAVSIISNTQPLNLKLLRPATPGRSWGYWYASNPHDRPYTFDIGFSMKLDDAYAKWQGIHASLTFKAGEPDKEIFIAIPVPEAVRKKYKHVEGLEDDLHITLVYVPDVSTTDKQQQAIVSAVHRVCADSVPFTCQFTGLGSFDNGSDTYAALCNIPMGAEIQTLVEQAIEKVYGEWKKKFGYLPHMTLKYKGDGETDLDDLRDFKWTCNELKLCFADPSDTCWMIPIGKGEPYEVTKEKKESKLGRFFHKLAMVFKQGVVAVPIMEQLDYPNFALEQKADLTEDALNSFNTPEVGDEVEFFYTDVWGKLDRYEDPEAVEEWKRAISSQRVTVTFIDPERVIKWDSPPYAGTKGVIHFGTYDSEWTVPLDYWQDFFRIVKKHDQKTADLADRALANKPTVTTRKMTVDPETMDEISNELCNEKEMADINNPVPETIRYLSVYRISGEWDDDYITNIVTLTGPPERLQYLRFELNGYTDAMLDEIFKFLQPKFEKTASLKLADLTEQTLYPRDLENVLAQAGTAFQQIFSTFFEKSRIKTNVSLEEPEYTIRPKGMGRNLKATYNNDGPEIRIKYHFTDIVIFKSDHVELYTQGFHTKTTGERIGEALRKAGLYVRIIFKLHRGNYEWLENAAPAVHQQGILVGSLYVSAANGIFRIEDGLELDYTGNVLNAEPATRVEAGLKFSDLTDEILGEPEYIPVPAEDQIFHIDFKRMKYWVESERSLLHADNPGNLNRVEDCGWDYSFHDNPEYWRSMDYRDSSTIENAYQKWKGETFASLKVSDLGFEALSNPDWYKEEFERIKQEGKEMIEAGKSALSPNIAEADDRDFSGRATVDREDPEEVNSYLKFLLITKIEVEAEKKAAEAYEALVTDYAQHHGWEILQNDGDWEFYEFSVAKRYHEGIDTCRLQMRSYEVDVQHWVTQIPGMENAQLGDLYSYDFSSTSSFYDNDDLFTSESTNHELQENDDWSVNTDPMSYVSYDMTGEGSDINSQSESAYSAYWYILGEMISADTFLPEKRHEYNPEHFVAPEHWPDRNMSEEAIHEREHRPSPDQYEMFGRGGQPLSRPQTVEKLWPGGYPRNYGSLTFDNVKLGDFTEDALRDRIVEVPMPSGVTWVVNFESTPWSYTVKDSSHLFNALRRLETGKWEVTYWEYQGMNDWYPLAEYLNVLLEKAYEQAFGHTASLAFDKISSYLDEGSFTGWIEPDGTQHYTEDHFQFALNYAQAHPDLFPHLHGTEQAWQVYLLLLEKGWFRVSSDSISIGPLNAGGKSALVEYLSALPEDSHVQVEENDPREYWEIEGDRDHVLNEIEKIGGIDISFDKVSDLEDRPSGLAYWGWISPSGDFYQLEDYGTKYHALAARQIIANNEQYAKLYQQEQETESEFLLRMGWVRVNQGTSFEVGRQDNNTQSNILTFVAKLPKNYHITITQFIPETGASPTLWYGDKKELLESFGDQKFELSKFSDWGSYLQSHQIDVPEFWRYAKRNQIWSFIREGVAQRQGEYVRRFVKILSLNPEQDLVSGHFAYDVESAMTGDVVSEGQPMVDKWANIMFVQSVLNPVTNGTE